MTTSDERTTTEFWDGLYGERERVWSGTPNEALIREAAGLTKGAALELGCGEGADAIWLAEQGWRVTATDVSQVALDRAAGHARERKVTVDFQRHDLADSFPEGTYDLVTAFFLHSPVDMPRAGILRAAAAAVRPGGVLLIVGHAGPPSYEAPQGHGHHHEQAEAAGRHHDMHFPTPDEILEELALPDGEWEVLVSDTYTKHFTGPDGEPATRPDNTLKLRRMART